MEGNFVVGEENNTNEESTSDHEYKYKYVHPLDVAKKHNLIVMDFPTDQSLYDTCFENYSQNLISATQIADRLNKSKKFISDRIGELPFKYKGINSWEEYDKSESIYNNKFSEIMQKWEEIQTLIDFLNNNIRLLQKSCVLLGLKDPLAGYENSFQDYISKYFSPPVGTSLVLERA